MNSATGWGALTFCLLAVTACGGAPPDPEADDVATASAPRASTRADFSQPLTARGADPAWTLFIDGTRLRLVRPGEADVLAEAPGATIVPGHATWVATAPGETLTATLYLSECTDGMSDTKYPMSAEVALTNDTLRGCAGTTAQAAKPVGP